MAQLVIAALGAAIGGAIAPGVVALGMTGASIGWLAGSLVGASFAPTQKSEGPKLGDLQVGSSSYGTAIPYIQGHPRIAGQIVWASTKREIATTTRSGGKGGGGSEFTSYTYEVDLLIMLTDNVAAGLQRIWRDGKLVMEASPDPAHVSPQWNRLTFYSGASSQLPDPTYEAAVGTANAPAYRGHSTVMIQGLQLGGSGVIPNLTFEISTALSGLGSSTLTAGTPVVLNADPSQMFKGISITPSGTAIVSFLQNSFSDIRSVPLTVSGSTVSAGTVISTALDQADDIQFVPLDSTRGIATYCDVNLLHRKFGVITYANGTLSASAVYTIDTTSSTSEGAMVAAALDSTRVLVVFANSVNRMSAAVINSSGGVGTFASLISAPLFGSPSGLAALSSAKTVCVYRVGTALTAAVIDVSASTATPQTSTVLFTGSHTFPNIVPITATTAVVMFFETGSGYLKAFVATVSGSTITTGTTYTLSTYSSTTTMSFSKMASGRVVISYQNSTTTKVDAVVIDVAGTVINVGSLLQEVSTAIGQLPEVVAVNSYQAVIAYRGTSNYMNAVVIQTAGPTVAEPTLGSVVSALCLQSGLSAGQIDVTALSAITTPVRALTVSQVSSARSVLGTLAQCYFFDAVLSDKIYFRPRGGASSATITFDELGNVVDGGTAPDPLALTQANELEIPAQMALTYSNVNGDYQTDTQYSDRLLTGQESTSTVQVPLAFTATEAKVIVDTMLQDGATGALRTVIHLGIQYAKLEPTDVVTVTGADGSTYRLRLLKKTDADGVLKFDAVVDDATVLVQSGTTNGGTASQTVVAAIAGTTLLLLDIPLLRDADDLPGHYIAVTGLATNWTHAGLFDSLDDVSYTANTTVSEQAALGTCTTTLGAWAGGNVFDETNTVTVNVGLQQLVSVTRDALLADLTVNAALIGSELVQYRTATLVSAGVYALSGLLRGRRGTEAAQTGHAASETFVKLGTTGMRFVALQSADLGKLRYYKAASAGQRLSAVTAKSITPAGINQKPFSPVNARADRTTTNTVLTWTRRTRLSTRLVGTLGINAPLGETTESYAVEVWDSTYATLKRTLAATTPTVTYLGVDQVTDFGSNQATVYLRIYQISATVGRGSVYQTSV